MLIRLFNLDPDLISKHSDEIGYSVMDLLKENLLLSEDAKNFLIKSQIYKSNLPISPYFDSLGLTLIPAGCYNLARKWIKHLNSSNVIKIGTILIGYLCYAIYSKQLQYYHNRYSYWSLFKYELNNEKSMELNKYFNGGKEYLEKIQIIMKILNENARSDLSLDWKKKLIHYLLPSTYYTFKKQSNDIDYFNQLNQTNQLTIFNLIK